MADPSDVDSAHQTPDWRILLWMPRGGQMPGGHVVQIDKTARALEEDGSAGCTGLLERTRAHRYRLGPWLRIDLDRDPRLSHRRRVPVTMSTIYWERSYRSDGPDQRPGARSIAGRAVRAARFAGAALHGRSALIQASLGAWPPNWRCFSAYESADLLLPNAVGEAESISRDLGVSTPMIPVPNGVDPLSFVGANQLLRGSALRALRRQDRPAQEPTRSDPCPSWDPGSPWSSQATITHITPATPSGAAPKERAG